jgi:COX assembly protein 1
MLMILRHAGLSNIGCMCTRGLSSLRMKATAVKKCDEMVKAFSACCNGRLISMVWACREQNQALDDCIRAK